jgi:hypothetical protein
MNSATQNSLNDDELLELAEFLVSEAVPETAMDIETLDGFLCALAVGPESVTLGEALPYVWSDDPGVGAAPVWASPDQHARITGLIGRMYAELAEAVFVVHLPEDRTYGLGVAAFEVGSAYLRHDPLERLARPVLARLVQQQRVLVLPRQRAGAARAGRRRRRLSRRRRRRRRAAPASA